MKTRGGYSAGGRLVSELPPPPGRAGASMPPAGKSPEVRAAEIIAASLDRLTAAIEQLIDHRQP